MNHEKKLLISVDMDTFTSLSNYYGVKDVKYIKDEIYEIAIPRILGLFKRFNIKATFFICSKDFSDREDVCFWIKKIKENGHELANHSLSHRYGISLLSFKQIEREIIGNHNLIKEYFDCDCVGFRAPGYNISTAIVKILEKNGYLYDSSLFPTSLTLFYKVYHCLLVINKEKKVYDGMDNMFSFFLPAQPYLITSANYCQKARGKNGSFILEIPIATSRFLKLPFYFNFHLLFSEKMLKIIFSKENRHCINYLLHAVDFVDYYKDKIDERFACVVNIKRPLAEKMEKIDLIISSLLNNQYKVILLSSFAKELIKSGRSCGLHVDDEESQKWRIKKY
ncbi:MAG: polysaccharide deacetylase family protein [Candidatus Omnitrophota bacterium]